MWHKSLAAAERLGMVYDLGQAHYELGVIYLANQRSKL